MYVLFYLCYCLFIDLIVGFLFVLYVSVLLLLLVASQLPGWLSSLVELLWEARGLVLVLLPCFVLFFCLETKTWVGLAFSFSGVPSN